MLGGPASTFVDLLRSRAARQNGEQGYLFLADGEREEQALTYGELDTQARAIAASIQTVTEPGARALLLYPPGLDFVAGFLGCLYAGVVAVPAYPPRPSLRAADRARLHALWRDAQASAVLTTTGVRPAVDACLASAAEGSRNPVVATDDIPDASAAAWCDPGVTAQGLACIQYTSGSTGSPRGVMLTHANLMHASAVIAECFEHTPASKGVIWLPPYHDMGLIGGILQPLYVGFEVVLMAPSAFLQRPIRWLAAISRYGGTTSGGPNFAYDLCAESIRPADLAGLDLSRWDVAFNGAEPIRAATLDRFAAAFEPAGFSRRAFYPCYGLAEATLLVSGGDKVVTPRVHEPGGGGGRPAAVSCGRARGGQRVVIVDPASASPARDGEVGEVWVTGPNVGRGYWGQPAQTQQVFHARLVGDGDAGAAAGEEWLRTGDLGFLRGGELFITGRQHDLVIVRGVNHHPHDIEQTVQGSDPALTPGAGAAFAVPAAEGADGLVVVQEVRRMHRRGLSNRTLANIREAVAQRHGLQLDALVIVAPGAVPRTSSGKVQRGLCRSRFLAGELEPLAQWRPMGIAEAIDGRPAMDDAAAVTLWLTRLLAEAVGVDPAEIDPAAPLARYGLDSAAAVGLAGHIAEIIGRDLDATLFWDYPDIQSLAAYLVDADASGGAASVPSPVVSSAPSPGL